MAAYWLMKSEPTELSIDDLARAGCESWDGVRNFQARNFMRQMRVGDVVFFYHSSCKTPGIVGLASIEGEAVADLTALDPQHRHFDPRATVAKPIWEQVKLAYRAHLESPLGLPWLRRQSELANLLLLRRGSRLSVMPVGASEAAYLLAAARQTDLRKAP